MVRVLQPSRDREPRIAAELVVANLVPVCSIVSSCFVRGERGRRTTDERRCGEELVDEFHEQVGSDSRLVRERHALREELDDPEDEKVAIQLERRRALNVATDINDFPSHRRNEEGRDALLGEIVAGEDPNELGAFGLFRLAVSGAG